MSLLAAVALIVALFAPVQRQILVARTRRRVVGAATPAGASPGAPPSQGAYGHDGYGGVPSWFSDALCLLDLGVAASRAWPVFVVAAVAAATWAAVASPTLLGVGAVAAAVGALVHRLWRPVRRRHGYEAELLGALATIVAAVQSGSSLGQALRRAGCRPGACGADLALVGARIDSGWRVQVALDRWAADAGEPAVALVADALAVAGQAGASQGQALGAVADTIRDRAEREREVRALASQAQASCVVLVALPVAFSATVTLADPRVAHFLLTTAAGWGCLLGGVLLDGTGAWWMARLVRRAR